MGFRTLARTQQEQQGGFDLPGELFGTSRASPRCMFSSTACTCALWQDSTWGFHNYDWRISNDGSLYCSSKLIWDVSYELTV